MRPSPTPVLSSSEYLSATSSKVFPKIGVVLNAEAEVGVVFERLVLCFPQAFDFQGDSLVSVHPGDLHTAIPFAVLDVDAPEEDQVVFELRDVFEECHPGLLNLCRMCEDRAANLLILHNCAGDVQ